MIGMHLRHRDGISGVVTGTVVQADGKAYARISDHWLPVDELHA